VYDEKALKAAMQEEEKKRKAAIERRAMELGDSHWVLDTSQTTSKPTMSTPLQVVQVGFAQIDSSAGADAYGDVVAADEPVALNNVRRYNMKKDQASISSSNELVFF
jgi:hypothetical protein